MRLLFLLPCLVGCSAGAVPIGVLVGVEAASVVVFGRGIGDIGISAATGLDCSLVRLDRGQSYCAERNPPVREAYCTRTLATVDCWPALPANRTNVADAPPPTAGQQRYRTARWPKSLTAEPL